MPLVHRYSCSCWKVSHLKAGDSLGLVSVTIEVLRSFPADHLSQHMLLRLLCVLMVINGELKLIIVTNLQYTGRKDEKC